MKRFLVLSLVIAPLAMADVKPFNYQLGTTSVSEDGSQIVIHAAQSVTISILPGGNTWPRLSLDESGNIYAGNVVIDGVTGNTATHSLATLTLPYGIDVTATARGYQFRRDGKSCNLSLLALGLSPRRSARDTLRHSNIAFSGTSSQFLALAVQFGRDGTIDNYRVQQIDIASCRVNAQKNLGHPDLLVELGHSEQGGWWITGSIEQTLLQSYDGRHWRHITLPQGVSSLVSSYVTNAKEIWLAAILITDGTESPHLLVYSADGGRHWRNVMADDPLLTRLPVGWLEGQKRRTPQ